MAANNSTPVSRVQPKTLADANDQVLAWSAISGNDVIISVQNLFSNVPLSVGQTILVGGANGVLINSTAISVNGSVIGGGGGYAGGNLVPTVDAVSVVGNSTSRFLSLTLANTLSVGNSSVNSLVNATSFSGTANAALNIGGISAANVVSNNQLQANLTNYQTTIGLAANVATLTANSTSFFGGQNSSFYSNSGAPVLTTSMEIGGVGNNVFINTTAASFGNSSVNASINSTSFTGIANNTLNVGGVSAANIVSNAQLQSNLTTLQPKSTLAANITSVVTALVPTLTANNSNNLGGLPASSYANNINPVISTSLEVGGVGTNVAINTTSVAIGNSSQFSVVNSTAFTGTSNNTLNVGGVSAANVVSNTQLQSNLASFQTLAGVSANVTPIVQSLVPTLTANNANNLGGFSPSNYANTTTPAIQTSISVGTVSNSVTANTTTISIGNSTVNGSVNSTSFSGTSNNALNLGGLAAASFVNNSTVNLSNSVSIGANVVANTSALKVGNSSYFSSLTNDTLTVANLNVIEVIANGSAGTANQVLTSAGPGANAFWANVAASGSNTGGPYGPNNSIAYNNAGVEAGDANLYWNATTETLGVNGTILFGNSTVNSTINSTFYGGRANTANNASNLGGVAAAGYAPIANPQFQGSIGVGSNVSVNTTTVSIGSNVNVNTNSLAITGINGNSLINSISLSFGNTTVNTVINSTTHSFTGVGSSASINSSSLNIGAANVSNGQVSIGNSIANVGINSTSLFIGNSTVNATVNSSIFTGLANDVLNVGGLPVANVVSNAQLQANLANYPLTAALDSIITTAITTQVPTLTANNALNLGGLPPSNYATLNGPSFTTNIQVTDGTNAVFVNTTAVIFSNTTVNTTINSTSYSGVANNTAFVGTTSAANVVSNTQLQSNLSSYALTSTLASYQTTAGLAANVAVLTANNANNFGGLAPSAFANITSPIFTTTTTVGNVVANTVAINISDATSTSVVNAHKFSTGNSTVFGSITPSSLTITNSGNTTTIGVNSLNFTDTASHTATLNTTSLSVGNVVLGGSIIANGGIGSAGQVLVSGGTLFNDSWQTFTSGAIGANTQIAFNNGGIESGDANLSWNTATATLTVNGVIQAANVALETVLSANGNVGTAGQVLVSGGATGNANWVTFTTGAVGTNTQIAYNNSGTEAGDANLTFKNGVTPTLSIGGATTNTQIGPQTVTIGATTVNSTAIVTSSYTAGANVILNTSSLSVGNSSVNTFVNSSSLSTNAITGFSVNTNTLTTNNLTSTNGLSSGNSTVNSTVNSTTFVVGNTSVNSTVISLGARLLANGASGANGQVLISGGATGNDSWATIVTGPFGPSGSITFNSAGTESGDANLTFSGGVTPVLSIGTTSNTQIAPLSITMGPTVVNSSVFQTGNSTVFTVANSTTDLMVGVGSNTTITASNVAVGSPTVYGLVNSSSVTVLNGTTSASITSAALFVGNSTVNTVVNSTAISVANLVLGFSVIANSSLGTHGQVLTSGGGISNDYWSTTAGGGAIGSNTQIAFNENGTNSGDANLTFTFGVTPILAVGTTTNTQIGAGSIVLGNSTVNATINSTTFTGTVLSTNTAAFIGVLPAANVVSNAMLIANLANYTNTAGLAGFQTAAGLAANVATLTSNNATNLGGLAAANYSNTSAPTFTTSVHVGANVLVNTSVIAVGNATVNSIINSTSFSGTANNALFLGGVSSSGFTNTTSPVFTTTVNVGSNVSINTSAIFLGNSTVNTIINSSSLGVSTLVVNGSVTFNGNITSGPGQFTMQGDILPIFDNSYYIGQPGNTWIGFFTTMTCGNTSVNSAINSTALFLGNSTVNTTITANVFQSSTSGIASLNIFGSSSNATINAVSIQLGNSVVSSTLTATSLTLANTSSSLIINSNSFTANVSANGFTTLPNGLIMQWGTILANTTAQTYTFPKVHAVNAFSIQLQSLGNGANSEVVSFTGTSFIANCGSATAVSFMWQSIGS